MRRPNNLGITLKKKHKEVRQLECNTKRNIKRRSSNQGTILEKDMKARQLRCDNGRSIRRLDNQGLTLKMI